MKCFKITVIIFILIPFYIIAQDFSVQKKELIEKRINSLLKEYELYSSFKGQNNVLSVKWQTSFLFLFRQNTATHLNDLSDNTNIGSTLTIDEYLQQLRSNFKNGLSVKVKLKRIELPCFRISKTEYLVNVKVRKKVVGINIKNQIHSFEKDLWIIIRFDKSLQIFKIFAVDNKPADPELYIPKEDTGKAFELFIAPSVTQITHDLSPYTNDFTGNSSKNIHFGARYRQPIVAGLNFLGGIRYSNYSGEFILNNYSNEYASIDADNEDYTRIVNSEIITETQKISYLDFQFGLQYRTPNAKKVKFYFSVSGLYSLVLKAEYQAKGTFSYEGYYPQYNITLFDLEQYNFPSNMEIRPSDELELASNFSILTDVGLEFNISEDINLNFGLYYQKGLKNISEYENNSFIISDTPNDYTSLMNASSSTKIQSYGLIIGLVFIL